jgi:PKD repeat protein
VQAKDGANNVDPSPAARSFTVDTQPPTNPTAIQANCGVQNNTWQNSCTQPQFTWSGAVDRGCSGVGGYEYQWRKTAPGTPQTLQSGATSSAAFNPASAVSDGVYNLTLRTKDALGHWSPWGDLFVLKYDATAPTVSVQIDGGASTTAQLNVQLSLTANDNLSGVADVRLSNNGSLWSAWQPYSSVVAWTLPAVNRQDHNVYVQVRDRAGNLSASASDSIYLELYPPIPHSANYSLCRSAVNTAGRGGLTSANYQLVSSVGQPGATSFSSANYTLQDGFLSDVTNCPPTTILVMGYQVTNRVLASAGGLRSSAGYRLGGTLGQTGGSGGTTLASTNYRLTSGFWSQITETIPALAAAEPSSPRWPAYVVEEAGYSVSLLPPAVTALQAISDDNFSVSINDNADYTTTPVVTVSVNAPNVTELRLSNDSEYQDDNWQTYQITNTWVLSTTGEDALPRTVYAWVKDEEGWVYGTYFDDIVYDPVGPEGSIIILGSDAVTDSVLLFIEAWDTNSGVAEMRIGDTPAAMALAAWQPYTDTVEWPWAGGSRVYIQFRDYAGSLSEVYNSDGTISGLTVGNDGPTPLGQTTTFTATVEGGSVITFTWDFGDGTAGSDSYITHTYAAVGNYSAVVTASNLNGLLTATTTVAITGTDIIADNRVYLPLIMKQ